jgi:hypothetical protein
MKKCTVCQLNLSLNQFSKHPFNKDGLYGQCKSCRKISRKHRESTHSISVTTKNCHRCKLNKEASQFVPNKSTKDGLNGWCKVCTKDSVLNHKYSISYPEYVQLLEKQSNKCAICSTTKPLGNHSVFVVDHCHVTGKVRGLLCNHCNTGLGKLGDTIESIEKALSYLKAC